MAESSKKKQNHRIQHRKHHQPVVAQNLVTMDENGVPFVEFQNKDNLHPASKAALKKMGLATMTEIQAKTFDSAAAGQDVLGRARTGTGKTLAFLLPSLERLLKSSLKNQINMLVLSPTRELAAQIGEQARLVLSSHGKRISFQVVFGGSPKNQDIRRFEQTTPTILVATPGRLRDHLQSTVINGQQFASWFRQTQILVLDEMDRLLDMGFRNEVEDIISYLPRERQTLLFSATMPPEVRSVMDRTMRSGYVTVDCVHDADPATHTNKQIGQSHVILATERLVSGTIEIILRLMDQPDTKLVVFFPTAHMVGFYSNVFNNVLGKPVIEIHSRKTQSHRTNSSNQFRESDTGVLFTSDVSARGVDYPDVSQVVQIGMADSRESYIHRLGRTGRAGKNGLGLLVVGDVEKGFLDKLKGLDLPPNQELQRLMDAPPSQTTTDVLNTMITSIRNADDQSLVKSGKDAYRSMLGFYNGKLRQVGVRSTDKLIAFANSFALQIGFVEPPALQLKTVRKMGLDRASGLIIDSTSPNKRPHREPSNNPAARKKRPDNNVKERGGSNEESGKKPPSKNNSRRRGGASRSGKK